MTHATAVLTALAAVVPADEVANSHFEDRLDTTDQWIATRTGIRTRRWAPAHVATGDLAVAAGRRALACAGPGDGPVDMVIVSTTTPDQPCPATAPAVAERLGLGPVAAFDVNAACSGFVYGLASAAGLLSSGAARRVLLVCAEVLSRITDTEDRGTAILFADAAAAMVLERGSADLPGALLGVELGSDGSGTALLGVPAGGSRSPVDADALRERSRYLRMDGAAVYRHAVERMTTSARTCLSQAGLDVGEIERFVGHQANARILGAVADRLGVPDERHFSDVDRFGNTSSASIPLALCDLAANDPPDAGALVLTSAFGAGFTWGSALLRWPDPNRIAPVTDYTEEEHQWITCSSR